MSRRKLVCVVVLVLVAAITQVARAEVVGPPFIGDRAYVDASQQLTIVDFSRKFTAPGKLVQWQLWAAGPGHALLQVYRQVGNDFVVIGQNDFTTAGVGSQTFNVPSGQQISVLAGDFIGFQYDEPNVAPRLIEMDVDGGQHAYSFYLAGQGGSVPMGSFTTGRTYSLAAFTSVPEPGSLAALAAGLVGLIGLRRKR